MPASSQEISAGESVGIGQQAVEEIEFHGADGVSSSLPAEVLEPLLASEQQQPDEPQRLVLYDQNTLDHATEFNKMQKVFDDLRYYFSQENSSFNKSSDTAKGFSEWFTKLANLMKAGEDLSQDELTQILYSSLQACTAEHYLSLLGRYAPYLVGDGPGKIVRKPYEHYVLIKLIRLGVSNTGEAWLDSKTVQHLFEALEKYFKDNTKDLEELHYNLLLWEMLLGAFFDARVKLESDNKSRAIIEHQFKRLEGIIDNFEIEMRSGRWPKCKATLRSKLGKLNHPNSQELILTYRLARQNYLQLKGVEFEKEVSAIGISIFSGTNSALELASAAAQTSVNPIAVLGAIPPALNLMLQAMNITLETAAILKKIHEQSDWQKYAREIQCNVLPLLVDEKYYEKYIALINELTECFQEENKEAEEPKSFLQKNRGKLGRKFSSQEKANEGSYGRKHLKKKIAQFVLIKMISNVFDDYSHAYLTLHPGEVVLASWIEPSLNFLKCIAEHEKITQSSKAMIIEVGIDLLKKCDLQYADQQGEQRREVLNELREIVKTWMFTLMEDSFDLPDKENEEAAQQFAKALSLPLAMSFVRLIKVLESLQNLNMLTDGEKEKISLLSRILFRKISQKTTAEKLHRTIIIEELKSIRNESAVADYMLNALSDTWVRWNCYAKRDSSFFTDNQQTIKTARKAFIVERHDYKTKDFSLLNKAVNELTKGKRAAMLNPPAPSIESSADSATEGQLSEDVELAKALSLIELQENHEHLMGLRAIERVKLKGGSNDFCKVIFSEPDGDCGFIAIQRYLHVKKKQRLADCITRKNIIKLVQKNYQKEDFKELIKKLVEADHPAGDIEGWAKAFSRPGEIWLATEHLQLLSKVYALKFYLYNQDSDPKKERYVPGPHHEIAENDHSNESFSVHLAHVSVTPENSEVASLNHFEGLCVAPTDIEEAFIERWNNPEGMLFSTAMPSFARMSIPGRGSRCSIM